MCRFCLLVFTLFHLLAILCPHPHGRHHCASLVRLFMHQFCLFWRSRQSILQQIAGNLHRGGAGTGHNGLRRDGFSGGTEWVTWGVWAYETHEYICVSNSTMIPRWPVQSHSIVDFDIISVLQLCPSKRNYSFKYLVTKLPKQCCSIWPKTYRIWRDSQHNSTVTVKPHHDKPNGFALSVFNCTH